MAILVSGASLGDGWLLGGLCWLVLRLLGRLDIIEKEQAETKESLEVLHRRFRELTKNQ